MKYVEMSNWPHAGTLTVGDDPVEVVNGLRVYELISAYEHIDKRANGVFVGRYKHVAVNGRELFIFDMASRRPAGSFGPYRAYSTTSDAGGVRLSEVTL
ncbi:MULTISPECIES: hypothetical protein [Xanthomonas]|uniref:Uncharacterized protein n=1 Tax=Xanthomonas sp. 10-10 TaxID=3115848 RepID=A0AAU7P9F5_9XANT